MQSWFAYVIGLVVSVWSVCVQCRHGGDRFYTAAVYEHRLLGEEDGGLEANLDYYRRAVKLAGRQGVDLIVFPEYGLVPPTSNRSLTRKDLEIVPDPKRVSANPCEETESFRDRPILSALSCMAKENDMVVVANMGGLEPCTDGEGCPADGVLQHNTNVAFDRNGTLLARYYKEYLYFEISMDLPREKQDPIFKTDFGTFAMFICFDMFYEKMAATARLPGVDAVLFSTMFFNTLPFSMSTQFFESWAIGNDATLLASNIQVPGHALSGSGIFRGRRGPAVLTQNPDGIGKLLVATLPRGYWDYPSRTRLTAVFQNGTGEVREVGTDVPNECDYKNLGETEDIFNEFRCMTEDVSNYTLAKLEGREGHLSACHNGMCCELEYAAESMDETFYLGVSNSTNNSSGRYEWAEENCFLLRCDDVGEKSCSHFPLKTQTLFHRVTMKANFTTDYVYPSMVGSAFRLVPTEDWDYVWERDASTIAMTSSPGVALIAATFKGRAYHRDPPFIQ